MLYYEQLGEFRYLEYTVMGVGTGVMPVFVRVIANVGSNFASLASY